MKFKILILFNTIKNKQESAIIFKLKILEKANKANNKRGKLFLMSFVLYYRI